MCNSDLLVMKQFVKTAVEARVSRILSVDWDTVFDSTLPMRIAIFPVAIRCVIYQTSHTHLKNKEKITIKFQWNLGIAQNLCCFFLEFPAINRNQ